MSKNRKQMPLIRLTEELYSKPHLISPSSFYAITSYLEKRNSGLLSQVDMMKLDVEDGMDGESEDEDKYDPFSGVGVIEIYGALTYRPINTMCGEIGMSYQDLLDDISEMCDAGANTIILNFDSGGGEAYGAWETANEMRKKCDDAGVTLIAYVDGQCCSAAYALACACDEVVTNPMGEVGSIGVLVGLVNSSEALKMEGYQRTFIYAGEEKIPFAEDGSWKQSFLDGLQESVDSLYKDFCTHVSKYTGLSVEAIKSTQAKVFNAKDALALGLVNKVATKSEFIDYVAQKQNRTIGALDAEGIS